MDELAGTRYLGGIAVRVRNDDTESGRGTVESVVETALAGKVSREFSSKIGQANIKGLVDRSWR